jgi:hypothetical protein
MAFGALAKLARTLRELARVPARVSAPFAGYVTRELQRGLRAGQDPYGKALPALKPATIARKGHARILQRSLALLSSLKATPLPGAGVGLSVGPPYAAIHIAGDLPRMVARHFFPTNVMPAKWRAELKRLIAEQVKAGLP